MKTWKKVALALGLTVAVGTTAAIAANGHRGAKFQQRITARVNRMLDKLNATADQRQKINAIVDDALTKLQAQRENHAQARGFWMQALTDPNMTEAQLDAQADAHAAQMANTAKQIIIPALVNVRSVLTDAQRAQLATMMKNHAHGPQGGFGGPDE
jgi:Spy/CpxP family protein refolding chaperone